MELDLEILLAWLRPNDYQGMRLNKRQLHAIVAEIDRLRAENEQLRMDLLQAFNQLAACSEILSKRAEK